MTIKNNTTGKNHSIAKSDWEAMSKMQKAGFTVVSDKDEDVSVQVVENKKTVKVAPDTGEKKVLDKKAEVK